MSGRSPYMVLGVDRNATAAEIRAAYRRRVKETHPDLAGGAGEAFLELQAAFRALVDPSTRDRVDDPDGASGLSDGQEALERRKAQLKRRRARVSKLYD